MTDNKLKESIKEVFNTYSDDKILYALDNGNIWRMKYKASAEKYSKRLNKELLTFKREEVFKAKKTKAIKKTTTKKVKKDTKKSSTKKIDN